MKDMLQAREILCDEKQQISREQQDQARKNNKNVFHK